MNPTMNIELKALIETVFDSEEVVAKLVAKEGFFNVLPKIFEIVTTDLPADVSDWGDLPAEIQALPGSAQEADLVNYIESKFAGAVDNAKAQRILSAVLKIITDLAQDGVALKAALDS